LPSPAAQSHHTQCKKAEETETANAFSVIERSGFLCSLCFSPKCFACSNPQMSSYLFLVAEQSSRGRWGLIAPLHTPSPYPHPSSRSFRWFPSPSVFSVFGFIGLFHTFTFLLVTQKKGHTLLPTHSHTHALSQKLAASHSFTARRHKRPRPSHPWVHRRPGRAP
jgi:hypothetical protein